MGRDQSNLFCLTDKSVTQHHAMLVHRGDGFTLEDSDSTNGTFVNGTRISNEPVPLEDGDVIGIGSVEIRYEYLAHPVDQPMTALAAGEAEGRQEKLHIVTSAGLYQTVGLGGTVVGIGRLPNNLVCINDKSVSHYHAVLLREGQGYRLVDLRSTNGTFLNGERISGPVLLENGDEVRLGSVKMRYEVLGAKEESRPLATEARTVATADRHEELHIVTGAEAGQSIDLTLPWLRATSRITIGREPGSVILLTDKSVSRQHAALLRYSVGYMLEDGGSENGTFLNGARITKPVVLEHGDKIRVGTVELQYAATAQAAGQEDAGPTSGIYVDGERYVAPVMPKPAEPVAGEKAPLQPVAFVGDDEPHALPFDTEQEFGRRRRMRAGWLAAAALLVVGLAMVGKLRRHDPAEHNVFNQPHFIQTPSGTNMVVTLTNLSWERNGSAYQVTVHLRMENPNGFSLELDRESFGLADGSRYYYVPQIASNQTTTIDLPPHGAVDKEQLTYALPGQSLTGTLDLELGRQYWVQLRSGKRRSE